MIYRLQKFFPTINTMAKRGRHGRPPVRDSPLSNFRGRISGFPFSSERITGTNLPRTSRRSTPNGGVRIRVCNVHLYLSQLSIVYSSRLDGGGANCCPNKSSTHRAPVHPHRYAGCVALNLCISYYFFFLLCAVLLRITFSSSSSSGNDLRK